LQPEDFVTRPRDSVRERELARRVRQLPEEERFTFIRTLIDKDVVVGLLLARACLRDRKYFKTILDQGLKTADASFIKLWLTCVIPPLGFRKVVRLVTDKLSTEPKGVEKAAYWLWVMRPHSDPDALQELLKLNHLLREKGLMTPIREHTERNQIELTIDGESFDPQSVGSLRQDDPFPGGHEYTLVITGPDVHTAFCWLSAGTHEFPDRDLTTRVFWQTDVLMCGRDIPPEQIDYRYFLNSIRHISLKPGELRITGECSPVPAAT
jgi:hypothetical protein